LKLDGMAFLAGVLSGIMVFSEVVEPIRPFWENNTNWGRYTLPEMFGTSPGMVVFLIVVVALGCFVGAETVEGMLRKPAAIVATPSSPTENKTDVQAETEASKVDSDVEASEAKTSETEKEDASEKEDCPKKKEEVEA
jgi:hypothetical protein